jgi:hypothetical protein
VDVVVEDSTTGTVVVTGASVVVVVAGCVVVVVGFGFGRVVLVVAGRAVVVGPEVGVEPAIRPAHRGDPVRRPGMHRQPAHVGVPDVVGREQRAGRSGPWQRHPAGGRAGGDQGQPGEQPGGRQRGGKAPHLPILGRATPPP